MEIPDDKIEEVADRLEGLIARMETRLDHEQRQQVDTYQSLLRETVEVLVSTKSSFHSRQLKRLRERIEAALE